MINGEWCCCYFGKVKRLLSLFLPRHGEKTHVTFVAGNTGFVHVLRRTSAHLLPLSFNSLTYSHHSISVDRRAECEKTQNCGRTIRDDDDDDGMSNNFNECTSE